MHQITPPINRLPVEILQEIFTTVVDEPSHLTVLSRLKNANAISHVDRHWRLIALETRCLWVDIWMPLYRAKEAIEEYWAWTRERIKTKPLRIEIRCPTGATLDQVPWDFKTLSSIESLRFMAGDAHQLEALFQDGFQVPSCNIGELSLRRDGRASRHHFQSFKLTSEKLAKWPPIQRLNIEAGVWFSSNMKNNQMIFTTELHIDCRNSFYLPALAGAFPKLEKLSLHSRLRFITGNAITPFQSLKEIAFLSDATGHLLFIVHCPSLTTLCMSSSFSSKEVLLFLSRHPTIHTYEAAADQPSLVDIAAIAPQIQSIYIHEEVMQPFDSFNNDEVVPFPNLTDLSINSRGHPFRLDEFDVFIRQRCLPISNPNSRTVGNKIYTRIQTLSITCTAEPTWRSSEVLRSARQKTMTSGNGMEKKWVVNLSWD